MSPKLGLTHLLIRYLNHIYQDTVHLRYQAQKACLERDANALLLDVGCQQGDNTALLAAEIGTQHVLGLDYNERTLRRASLNGMPAIRGDANRPLPFPSGSIDVVTAMDVIEHLADPRMLVTEAYRVLKPGGYVVLATPNLASWHNIFALLIGMQPFSGPNLTTMLDADVDVVRRLHRQAHGQPEEGKLEHPGDYELHRHIVVVAFRAMITLLERIGFSVVYARGFGYYPLPPPLSRVFANLDPWHTHHMVIKGRKPGPVS